MKTTISALTDLLRRALKGWKYPTDKAGVFPIKSRYNEKGLGSICGHGEER